MREETLLRGPARPDCQFVHARLESGPETGKLVRLQLGGPGGLDPTSTRATRSASKAPKPPPGADQVTGTGYSLYDFERRRPCWCWRRSSSLVVLVFARLRGALSLVGLGVSLAIVLLFVVPAILDGKPPLAVAVVGSMAIASSRFRWRTAAAPKSLSALLGTAASLMLTAALAVLFTDLTHLTGLASEEATFLQIGAGDLSLQGLLLAGIVIGALGVLDDVTISQASTVLALRARQPGLALRRAVRARARRRARPRERDGQHARARLRRRLAADRCCSSARPISASATPSTSRSWRKEIVATLVGSIGLIAAVPITTALAALLALREDPERLAGAEPAHAHWSGTEAAEPLDAAVAVAVAGGGDEHVGARAAQAHVPRDRIPPAARQRVEAAPAVARDDAAGT